MFWTRLASGIVLVAVTIALMVNGGWPLFWVVTAISLIGLFELYRVADLHKTPPAVIGYISSVVLDILILDGYYEYLILWLILTLMVMMACYVIAYPKYHTDQMTLLFFGLVYVTIMMSFIFKVRYLEGGILTVWLIFVASWGSDTCAYCAGKLFGKHKLPSKLSPNKTIEGCLGRHYRCSADRIFVCAGVLSSGDRILVAVCIDRWSGIRDLTDRRSHRIRDQEKL